MTCIIWPFHWDLWSNCVVDDECDGCWLPNSQWAAQLWCHSVPSYDKCCKIWTWLLCYIHSCTSHLVTVYLHSQLHSHHLRHSWPNSLNIAIGSSIMLAFSSRRSKIDCQSLLVTWCDRSIATCISAMHVRYQPKILKSTISAQPSIKLVFETGWGHVHPTSLFGSFLVWST